VRRREFITLLGATATWPSAALAQRAGKKPVLGFLVVANPEPVASLFKAGLHRLGYVDGQNIQIEMRSAEGKADLLPGLAAELVRLKVDILVAAQTPAVQAAKQATKEIPIVMAGRATLSGPVWSRAFPGREETSRERQAPPQSSAGRSSSSFERHCRQRNAWRYWRTRGIPLLRGSSSTFKPPPGLFRLKYRRS
jgi:hypothetical protein